MFIGEFTHALDTKGRVSIPSKFREALGDQFYITKGLDNCLFVFPKNEWQLFEEKLKALPMTNKNARAFVRLFFSGASECELDKQGRILIPQTLREHAGIEREAVIIGTGTRIEVWSQDGWNGYIDPENIDYDEIAEHMAELGI
ncbi:division/cell wall cluster transcriptional repressor MraZ [Acidaminobacter hydrogenoformans]|uniref:Transcriptional regulator MraZ n=1 Tax=Acidaminobacter hydrogenoformans DSM 2784 TaxID=1120920 RepID=A0A1G5RSF3_9FIRM|nr:division/cell wall cluster transcriptional repressor MraZ [Acidaminobacter hydrogenoformans]SCZ77035.1 MraZ protein [Acidaminobacter hydrogenoformans DSM 2784]